MKIVVDTNILVNALFLPNKYPDDYNIFRAIDNGFLNFVVSNEIDEEIRNTVMMLAKMKNYSLDLFDNKIYQKINHCLSIAEKVTPTFISNYSRHEPDNRFIEATIEAKANYLISNNIDITEIIDEIQDKYNFKICSPFQFKKIYNFNKIKYKKVIYK